MAFTTAVSDVWDSNGASLVKPNPDGTRPPLVIKLGPGLAGSFAKDGDLGVVTITPSSASQMTLPLTTSLLSANGNGGSPTTLMPVLPSRDFPGATSAIFKSLLWCDVNGNTVAWAASTSYTVGPPPSIIKNPTGAGGAAAAYVCTTGGTSSGAHGPVGVGSNLQDAGGSACRWRSALATLTLYDGNFGSLVQIGSVSTAYTIAAAFAGAGLSLLEVSFDVSSILIPLTSEALLTLGLTGDSSDTGGTSYTTGYCSEARIVFS